jgi:hypothetical protein
MADLINLYGERNKRRIRASISDREKYNEALEQQRTSQEPRRQDPILPNDIKEKYIREFIQGILDNDEPLLF